MKKLASLITHLLLLVALGGFTFGLVGCSGGDDANSPENVAPIDEDPAMGTDVPDP